MFGLLCCIHLLFFFFKQKTAYEMRISDWSSDVCSSDLMLEMHRLAPELENALDVRMIERVAHQTPFHHQDLIPNALDHREVVVHDQVKDAVDDIVRPFPGMGCDAGRALSQLMIERRRASANRDDA